MWPYFTVPLEGHLRHRIDCTCVIFINKMTSSFGFDTKKVQLFFFCDREPALMFPLSLYNIADNLPTTSMLMVEFILPCLSVYAIQVYRPASDLWTSRKVKVPSIFVICSAIFILRSLNHLIFTWPSPSALHSTDAFLCSSI